MVNENVRLAIQSIFDAMRAAGYSERTINYYRQNYDRLLQYLEKNDISEFTDQVGLCYLSNRYGIPIEDFYQKQPSRITNNIRSLKVLWDYIHLGSVCFDKKSTVDLFQCPAPMKTDTKRLSKSIPTRRIGITSMSDVSSPILKIRVLQPMMVLSQNL